MTAAARAERIRKRLQDWREENHPPITLWNTNGRRRLIIGGGQTRGWMITPRITLDPTQLTVGITWQAPWRGIDYEDPDPVISLHLPGIYAWARICHVLPGYRARRAAQRAWSDQAGRVELEVIAKAAADLTPELVTMQTRAGDDDPDLLRRTTALLQALARANPPGDPGPWEELA